MIFLGFLGITCYWQVISKNFTVHIRGFYTSPLRLNDSYGRQWNKRNKKNGTWQRRAFVSNVGFLGITFCFIAILKLFLYVKIALMGITCYWQVISKNFTVHIRGFYTSPLRLNDSYGRQWNKRNKRNKKKRHLTAKGVCVKCGVFGNNFLFYSNFGIVFICKDCSDWFLSK